MDISRDTWLISDTHFGHYNMIKLCDRPLNFNEKIYNNWKKMVKKDDVILHLGDVAIFFGPSRYIWLEFVRDLPGKKYLIKGNHDKLQDRCYHRAGFKIIPPFSQMFGDICVEFSHEPIALDSPIQLNIHGHMHGQNHHDNDYRFELDKHIDVGVDVTNFKPIRVFEALEQLK